jgi:1,2-dihydroxy-3-keto-5-methylthiopentene dioxygenase
MTTLTIADAGTAAELETVRDFPAIAQRLATIGVRLERWETDRPLSPDAQQEEVLAAYADSVAALNAAHGFQSVDVVSLRPDSPKCGELRQKFLAEHTHDDFEIRFFVDGGGLFYLHVNGRVYMTLCAAGDLISVPANTTHWFDMGAAPSFKCIRFFTTADGWVGHFTGSDIARRFPDYDQHLASLAAA